MVYKVLIEGSVCMCVYVYGVIVCVCVLWCVYV